ncbi:MAG: hypothetical protein JO306_06465 [Gemmatimonadetes bacterium]|nr:hypothetical protein [Gemmatimonadota bacterium]
MSRNPIRRLLSQSSPTVVLALVATAACSDTASNPAATAAPAAPRAISAVSQSRLVSNSVKYHDGSAPHATGRSGSAHLEGLAVLGGDGVTRLTITTGDLDHLSTAPGQIVKAQLKAFGTDGGQLFVDNRNNLSGGGTQTFLLHGLTAGSRIQVQANVRGIDGRRNDVVTITESVKRAPALDVQVNLPGNATVGSPAVITATVTETNGDLGTRADCVLYVDGKPVDSASGIWVDAGGAVTCAFTYTFTDTGTHAVEVRVNGLSAGGSLGANVGDGGSLNVGGGGAPATYTASVEDRSVTTASVLDYTWWKPDGSHKEYWDGDTTTARTQTISVQGTLGRAAVFPLASVDLSMESGGIAWESEHWLSLDAVADANGNLCVNRQVDEQGALFYVCNGLGGATWSYTRFAGTVTYHSTGYANIFDGVAGTQNNYSWNNGYQEFSGGGQTRSFGPDVTVRVNITDLGGSVSVAPTITLSPFSGTLSVTPRTCSTDSPYWLDGGTQTTCNSGSQTEQGRRGSAQG